MTRLIRVYSSRLCIDRSSKFSTPSDPNTGGIAGHDNRQPSKRAVQGERQATAKQPLRFQVLSPVRYPRHVGSQPAQGFIEAAAAIGYWRFSGVEQHWKTVVTGRFTLDSHPGKQFHPRNMMSSDSFGKDCPT